jgi:hypothetical protein
MKQTKNLPPLRQVNEIIERVLSVRNHPEIDIDKFVAVLAEATIMKARVTSLMEVRNAQS